MIIPVGHEQQVRRLPYLTISLIGLNFLMFLITYPLELRQRNRLIALDEELREVEVEYLLRYMLKDPFEAPEKLRSPDIYRELRAQLESGDLVDTETDEYRHWKALHDQLQAGLEGRVFYRLGHKPGKPSLGTLITSMFLHGGFGHLFFNMLFLWLVGCNMEDDWGRPVFLSLYLVGGFVASLTHTAFDPASQVPLIGASGAISAAMGAFMIRHYKTKIRFCYFFLILFRPIIGTFRLYAGVALGLWFLQQLFYGLLTRGADVGVAFWAHVGGFLFGTAAGVGIRFFKVEEKYLAPKIEDEIEKVKLNPKMARAFELKDKGDLKGATGLLKEVVSEEPANVDGHLELARTLLLSDGKEEAASEFGKAIEHLFSKGETETAVDVYREAAQNGIEAGLSPGAKFRVGTRLSAQGKYWDAVQLYGMIVRDHPGDGLAPLVLLRCGKIFYENLGERDLARGALTHLLANYPDFEGREEARKLLEAMVC